MESYNDKFFSHVKREALNSAAAAVPVILDWVPARSVLDVGCGLGVWAAEFRKQGLEDVQGIDGPWVDPAQLLIPRDTFQVQDLESDFDLGRRFDLIVSLEVAEHLHAPAARTFVRSLVRHADRVVFSAAIPHQGGTHHYNEQWPQYWLALFQEAGYVLVDALRADLWHREGMAGVYAQNMLLFVSPAVLEKEARLREARERTREDQIDLVHPKVYNYVVEDLEGRLRHWAEDPTRIPFPLLAKGFFLKLPSALLRRLRPDAHQKRGNS